MPGAMTKLRVEPDQPTRRREQWTRYAPGDQLQNGARVTVAEKSEAGEFVLCRWDREDGRERWVTWFVARSGATVLGHYHDSIEEAFSDFRRRVAGRA